MGFLDKLKPQPRWKHADPSVRLEALRDLDDPVELGHLAESDPDARVRRATVTRVTETDVLGRLAASDPDTEVRDRAAERLVQFACRADRGNGDGGEEATATAFAAVRQLSDQRRLSTVAKSEAPEAVRADALGRITDERALSGIARQAKSDVTATEALARLTDADELLEVTLNASSVDVAVAAFDRLSSRSSDITLLRSVETRAQHKSVSRKARTLIGDLEAAAAAEAAALEERRRRECGLCDAVEQVASVADLSAAHAELARVTDAWSALDVTDPSLLERFQRGHLAAEQSIARREREAAEAADIRRLRAEAIATRDALCARVETLDGDDVLEQLVPIEEEWRSLLPLVGNGPEADRLAERFARAVAACRKRHEMGARLAETRVALATLVEEAEGLSSDDPSAPARWESLSREARGLTAVLAGLRPADDLTARLDAVGERFAAAARDRQAAADAAVDRARQDALRQFRQLMERAKRASDADSITLREGDRLMRDLSAAFELAHRAPGGREVDEAVAALRTLQEQLAPRVRELREMDEWRRFANAQRQEQLIAMAEAIVQSLKTDEGVSKASDLAATARALRELHSKWQEVAEAPRQTAQRLWDRFRTATDFIRARCETHFSKVREERAATLERKTAIVVEAETLAASTEWARAAVRFQELQTEWQALGPVSRDTGRELAQRFRAACSSFFNRRREDLTERKKTWSENLSRKEALCERAEAIADSTDWEATSVEVKRLQAEWKTIGPVRRNKSEIVWNRFRAAADRFFTRYHDRHQITLITKIAEREALVVELEALASFDPTNAPADLGERAQQLRTTWNRSVPIPVAEFRVLTDRWQAALSRLVAVQPQAFAGTDLDPSTVIQRMEKLVARVESYLQDLRDPTEGLSHTEMLAAKLRSALASNAMGGRAGEEAKWRGASDAVKDAQAAWQRLAPVSGPEAEALTRRFREACRRISDRVRRGSSPRRSEEREAAAV